MKLAESIPFSAELTGPQHTRSYLRAGAAPQDGEFTLDASWGIAAPTDNETVALAADDLREFLRLSLGLTLAGGGPAIDLRVDERLGDNPETHLLRMTPEGVEVVGAGPAGVLHGCFRLQALMQERGGPILPIGEERRTPIFQRRIHRSILSPFNVEELTGYSGPPLEVKSPGIEWDYPGWREEDAGPDMFYHDNMLMRLARHGFNGIWVRGALRVFAKTQVFPEFGEHAEQIMAQLRRLSARAARFGIGVYLYLNEPMGFDTDDPFWDKYPHCRGPVVRHTPVNCFCSSTDECKRYLREATEYVFAHAPDLAGVILITASEYPSHCYCHQPRPEDEAEREKLVAEGKICPRCAPRTPQEIIGEIVTLIQQGARAAKPSAEVIAWNWSWNFYEPDPQRGVLERLPEGVIVMGDFERGTPTSCCGFEYVNDEYSIKVIGPSGRFTGVAEFQRGRGLPTYAKVQIGTTHEVGDLPYLPALGNIARKYRALRDSGVTGIMSCWNFGGHPSLATELAGEMSWAPQPEPDEALRRVATRHFGPAAAAVMVEGWEQVSRAHECFPGSIPVLYHGPVNRGPALPFPLQRVDREFPRSWLLDRISEHDRLDSWTRPFGPEKVAECFRAEAEGLATAVSIMDRALQLAEGDDLERLKLEHGVAKMFWLQLACSANLVEFLLTRNALLQEEDASRCAALLERIEQLCRQERELVAQALPLLQADPRLGFHGEGYGYMLTPELLQRKLAHLDANLNEGIAALRAAKE